MAVSQGIFLTLILEAISSTIKEGNKLKGSNMDSSGANESNDTKTVRLVYIEVEKT